MCHAGPDGPGQGSGLFLLPPELQSAAHDEAPRNCRFRRHLRPRINPGRLCQVLVLTHALPLCSLQRLMLCHLGIGLALVSVRKLNL